ncbi:hypothetical protein [Cellulomonas sp. ICMP 17802]|uniref:hypothetical protein n=1 Tax=Cellulomonas sp. ICMP 17802 TaxID=3239199 RepID=UPI00351BB09E
MPEINDASGHMPNEPEHPDAPSPAPPLTRATIATPSEPDPKTSKTSSSRSRHTTLSARATAGSKVEQDPAAYPQQTPPLVTATPPPVGGSKTARATTRGRVAQVKAPAASSDDGGVLADAPSVSAFEKELHTQDRIEDLLGGRLKAKVAETTKHATTAKAAFAKFAPSALTPADRARGVFLPQGRKLATFQATAVANGVTRLNDTADQRHLRVTLADAASTIIGANDRGQAAIPVKVGGLVKFLDTHLKEAPALTLPSIVSRCAAQLEAAKRLREGTLGTPTPAPPPTPSADTAVITQQSTSGTTQRSLRAKDLVHDYLPKLIGTMTSPETPLDPLTSRATLDDTERGIDTFQLRAGASDVTSYHDFHTLRVAFDHVWTELVDDNLRALGEEMYALVLAMLGGQAPQLPAKVDDLDDLRRLLTSVAELSGVVERTQNEPGSSGAFSAVATGGISTLGGFHPNTSAITGDKSEPPPLPGSQRLSRLLTETLRRLNEPYSFRVFPERAYNFGFLATYRQTWTPERYQVGDLVSTIPLAPREVRKYTTRRVVKTTRATKELEDSLRTTRTGSTTSARVEREIVDKAQTKTDYDMATHGSFGAEGSYKGDFTAHTGGDESAQSERIKRQFHEAVLNSSQEYRQQHRVEVDATTTDEYEETTEHEIQNPNEELTVTYMLYELQRRYRIQERLHQIVPVILVANRVPAPNEIDDAWVTAHDWILRRVILDDSFRPALDYLAKSFVGAELNINILEIAAKAQKQLADEIKGELKAQTAILDQAKKDLDLAAKASAANTTAEGVLGTVKRIFDPLQITGKEVLGTGQGVQAVVDYAQDSVDRAEREASQLLDRLAAATTTLQEAINRLAMAVKEHYERVAEIDRLRGHVKDNILYYMQAIWSHEPADQRFFRVYNYDISIPEPPGAGTPDVTATKTAPSIVQRLAGDVGTQSWMASMPGPSKTTVTRKLVDIADLDTVLGYKGNYAIYPLLQNNFVTLNMMQDYLEVSEDVVRLKDPDPLGNFTIDELVQLAECVRATDADLYRANEEDFKKLIVDRFLSGHPDDDRVIVPTNSLYMEALVGTHPLLEDFKLYHRALDVRKVQAEVRHAELENLRLAVRAAKGKDDDPDIDKKIMVEGVAGVDVSTN